LRPDVVTLDFLFISRPDTLTQKQKSYRGLARFHFSLNHPEQWLRQFGSAE